MNASGTKLFRAVFVLPKRMVNKNNITVTIPEIAPCATVYLNGKIIGSWNATDSAAKRRLNVVLPQSAFNKGENVLAIKADFFDLGGNSRFYINRLTHVRFNNGSALVNRLNFRCNLLYFATAKQLKVNKVVAYGLPFKSHQFQGALYNSMVASWTKLPIRGVIWYQGCSNAGKKHYYVLHKRLIQSWRAKWNKREMPFLIVQLAGFEPSKANTWRTADATNVSGYALTRDIQQEMLKIKNVGLACAIDIGEAANIHPANKQDVGLRLALEAQRIAYGKKIVSRGPLFKEAKTEGNSIRVFFYNAESGLATKDNQPVGAFAIAGADKKFVWAKAVIDGSTVVVSSPKVKNPKYVRYAYAGYRGDCNLQNKDALPAYPFTSLRNTYSDKD
jgi:sialate O-acetylesterase